MADRPSPSGCKKAGAPAGVSASLPLPPYSLTHQEIPTLLTEASTVEAPFNFNMQAYMRGVVFDRQQKPGPFPASGQFYVAERFREPGDGNTLPRRCRGYLTSFVSGAKFSEAELMQ